MTYSRATSPTCPRPDRREDQQRQAPSRHGRAFVIIKTNAAEGDPPAPTTALRQAAHGPGRITIKALGGPILPSVGGSVCPAPVRQTQVDPRHAAIEAALVDAGAGGLVADPVDEVVA
jgi:hypothetical protein